MADFRKQKRTSRLSVVISALFHALIIGVLAFVAAREGVLGKQLKKIAVTMVPREKPPEKPKEKPSEQKPQAETTKTEAAKAIAAPAPEPAGNAAATAPPPVASVAPPVAPPAAEVPSFDFEGGRAVETTSDPNLIYKGYLEYTLRSRWNRPGGIGDEQHVAEVVVAVDSDGHVLHTTWKKGSGDAAWDNSVRKVLAETPKIGRPPPRGFPEQVLVRFDVQVPVEIPLE
jgi:hypothetical protein